MDFLLYQPAWLQIVLVILIFSCPSVLGLYLVRLWVPLERLKENHEVAGFTFGVLGAFYGLLLAFVIVAAWERYDRADEKVQIEAVSLVELYRLASELGEPTRTQLHAAIRGYTNALVNQYWPSMANNHYKFNDDRARALTLWHIVGSYKTTSSREDTIVDKCLDQLDQITDSGSFRYLYYAESLPSVVWLVIYSGCIIVIGFSYFFGLNAFTSQALMCAVFSGLLGLTILAILELSHPYQGNATVSSRPLVYAVTQMDAMDALKEAKPEDPTLGAVRSSIPVAAPSK